MRVAIGEWVTYDEETSCNEYEYNGERVWGYFRYFKRVSHERYEEEHAVLERAALLRKGKTAYWPYLLGSYGLMKLSQQYTVKFTDCSFR